MCESTQQIIDPRVSKQHIILTIFAFRIHSGIGFSPDDESDADNSAATSDPSPSTKSSEGDINDIQLHLSLMNSIHVKVYETYSMSHRENYITE